MLSIKQCKTILKNENVIYDDTELEKINEFLSLLVELELTINTHDYDKP